MEQAQGQMQWLEAMHSAGLYKDELAYPHLRKMAVEFELPLPLSAKVDSAAPREIGSWNVSRSSRKTADDRRLSRQEKKRRAMGRADLARRKRVDPGETERDLRESMRIGWAAAIWARICGPPT